MRTASGEQLDLSAQFNPRHLSPNSSDGRKKVSLLTRVSRFVGFPISFVVETLKVMGSASLPGDTRTRFVRSAWPFSFNRPTIYFPSHNLSLIKALKDKAGHGVTVNDVEFSLFAGTIRRFLVAHDPNVNLARASMRAMTPLALLERADPETKYSTMLRNLFTFVMNELPIRQASPKERLLASHRSWARLKSSAAVPAAFAVHKLTANLPLAFQRKTLVDLMTRMTVVFSNVPGPQERCFLAGSEIESVHMIYHNLIPQIGILSLNGKVHMCLTMDPSETPDIDLRTELPKLFMEELEALAAELGVPMDV
jgi:diacylglycerol O-acyltransferase